MVAITHKQQIPPAPLFQRGVEADERRHDRIRWHARRGLLENDLILTRFLDTHLATMDVKEMALLEELLLWSDNDLLDVLMDRKAADDTRFQPLVERIKAAQY